MARFEMFFNFLGISKIVLMISLWNINKYFIEHRKEHDAEKIFITPGVIGF